MSKPILLVKWADEKNFNDDRKAYLKFDLSNVPGDAIKSLASPNYENILIASILHSDAIIIASEALSASLTKFIESTGKPFLPFIPKDQFAEAYTNFYKNSVL